MTRIYLDNAATSWPKPEAVYNAVDHYQREIGASAGRGAYQTAQEAQRIVTEARAACSRFLGVSDYNQIAITHNGTAALNLAIHGLLRHGDHVVTTVCEHNSVLRPLEWQKSQNGVDVTYVGCDAAGFVDPAAIAEAISPKTRLVAITHASNVTGAIQPITEIAKVAHNASAYILVDAAQTAGSVPIDVTVQDIDLLACGGHKGLLGPLGTGLLCIRPGLEHELRPTQQGGTGTDSLSESQPEQLPNKYEAGNLNQHALAGLVEAIRFLERKSAEQWQHHHQQITRQLLEGLATIPNITVYGPTPDQPRVGVVSCSVDGYDPQEFAAALDASSRVECRAGLHCAPRMHAAMGTDQTGGLIRFSPGWATTPEEIETALEAIEAIAASVPLP